MRPSPREHLAHVVLDPGARVGARRAARRRARSRGRRRRRSRGCASSSRSTPTRWNGSLSALGRELAVVGAQQHLALDRREAGHGLVVDDPHHLLGRDAVGRQRADQRAGAGADVDVEVVDRAVDRQQVERPQRADLVHGAREAAAAEHERGLRARRRRRRWGVSSLTTLPMARRQSIRRRRDFAASARVRSRDAADRPARLRRSLRARGAPAAQAAGPRRRPSGSCARRWRRRAPYSGAYVVDLGTGPGALLRGRVGAADPGLGREALHHRGRAASASGPQGALSTEVLGAGAARRRPACSRATSYLRGGGDPSFDAKAAGPARRPPRSSRPGLTEVDGPRDRRRVGLRRPAAGPPSEGYRTSSYVGPLSALTFNRGFTGSRRPLLPGQPAALRRPGVRRRRSSARGVKIAAAPAPASTPAGAVAAGGAGTRRASTNLVRLDERARRTTSSPRR